MQCLNGGKIFDTVMVTKSHPLEFKFLPLKVMTLGVNFTESQTL